MPSLIIEALVVVLAVLVMIAVVVVVDAMVAFVFVALIIMVVRFRHTYHEACDRFELEVIV